MDRSTRTLVFHDGEHPTQTHVEVFPSVGFNSEMVLVVMHCELASRNGGKVVNDVFHACIVSYPKPHCNNYLGFLLVSGGPAGLMFVVGDFGYHERDNGESDEKGSEVHH
jgi:hypothetical protein